MIHNSFKNFIAMVERQIDIKVKAIRNDNGGEYFSKEFDAFYQMHGIARQKTMPYSPWKNGVVENMKRTPTEKSRCMISNVKLSRGFWFEAISIACYLVNLSPSSTLSDKIPEESWIRSKPHVFHLRVFSYEVYMHVRKEKQKKMDENYKKCLFIGYRELVGVKGYKL